MDLVNSFNAYKEYFEQKYIVPISPLRFAWIACLVGAIFGSVVRIYYNDLISVFTTLVFEFSWFGIGWGKTPIWAQLTTIFVAISANVIVFHYVTNVKRRYYGDNTLTLKELLSCVYIDTKHFLYIKIYNLLPNWIINSKNK